MESAIVTEITAATTCGGSIEISTQLSQLLVTQTSTTNFRTRLEECFRRIKNLNYFSEFTTFTDFLNQVKVLKDSDKVVNSGVYIAHGQCDIKVCGNATIIALDRVNIIATKMSIIFAFDKARITSFENTQTICFDNSVFLAYENCQVKAYDHSKGKAIGFVNVKANDASIVDAFDRCLVTAKDNSTVRAYKAVRLEAHNHANIYLFDDALGFIYGQATAHLGGNSMICRSNNEGNIGRQNHNSVFILYPLSFDVN